MAEARAQLSKLVEAAVSTHERFEITRNGQRAAILLAADDYDALQEMDDYDALQEMIAALGDSQLLGDHLEGIGALERSDALDEAGLAETMREAGRLPARK